MNKTVRSMCVVLALSMTPTSFATAQVDLSRPLQYKQRYETVSVSNGFTVNEAQTKSISLGGPRKVKSLIVQAEGVYRDSTIEVMVNGEVKGTIYAPGSDPSYVVTVADVTRSIEFRYRTGGSMRILQVYAVMSDFVSEQTDMSFSIGDASQVTKIAQLTIQKIAALQPYVSSEIYNEFLFPIKKSAGYVYVMSSAHGNLSKDTVARLVNLMDQIDYAKPALDELIQRDGSFNTVVDLLTIRETLHDWMN